MKNDLMLLVGQDEKILYEGRPDRTCFIFESILNPMLPFALVWALIDLFMFSREAAKSTFLLGFFLIHMTPVWLYLSGVIFSFRKYNNIYYIVTDRAIYVSGGIFSRSYNRKPFAELAHIHLHRGVFDQYFNVGDVIATSGQFTPGKSSAAIRIDSIADYADVYKLVKKLQEDIYTDIMYPNAKRPSENPGYKTEYTGLDE